MKPAITMLCAGAARAWIACLAGPAGRRSFADNGLEAPR